MTTGQKDISVCICTFQRPGLLRKLLERLEDQRTNGRFTFSVVVSDNDSGRSSERVVAEYVATSRIAVTYTCESRQNIALARNEGLMRARNINAAGVLGPVRPHYESRPRAGL